MIIKTRHRWAALMIAVWLGMLSHPAWADGEPTAAKEEKPAVKKTVIEAQPEYVGTEECATCHEKEVEEYSRSTHARLEVKGDAKVQGCETCHGPGSLHVDAGGGKGVHIVNPGKDPSTCFQCHSEKKMEFNLPHRHPVLEGQMSCADCHSPHGEDVKPWTATSLKDVNEACFKCHKEQRGPFVWEHEAVREGCTTCHAVHGSVNEKMLVARDANVCIRCHTQADFPIMGKRDHRAFIQRGTCFSGGCHTAVHGSQYDDHLRY